MDIVKLTSLLRTARKQPLLWSEGFSLKKRSDFSGASALSGEMKVGGVRLDERNTIEKHDIVWK